MIDIEGNAFEYLLTVPFDQKERAKAIPGRRWDTERKVWLFKRTPEAYDALIAEFGDDLTEITITRPDTDKKSAETNPKWPFPSDQKSKEVPPSAEPPISQNQSPDRTQSLLTEINNSKEELKKLRDRITELELAKDPSSVEGFVAFAIASAGENMQLKNIVTKYVIDNNHFDSRLPIVLASELERYLRKKLGVNDPTLKLHDILSKAKEADLLSGDNFDLAHIIRKQRNFFAHQDIDQRTEVMRIVFTVCAASLLWPHITL
jgi:hypothetical protein